MKTDNHIACVTELHFLLCNILLVMCIPLCMHRDRMTDLNCEKWPSNFTLHSGGSGVPARGIIDSGADITIVGGELFR